MLKSVGAVAKEFGVSASLIRWAEGKGIIPPAERVDGTAARLYNESHLAAIRQWRNEVAGRSAVE